MQLLLQSHRRPCPPPRPADWTKLKRKQAAAGAEGDGSARLRGLANGGGRASELKSCSLLGVVHCSDDIAPLAEGVKCLGGLYRSSFKLVVAKPEPEATRENKGSLGYIPSLGPLP